MRDDTRNGMKEGRGRKKPPRVRGGGGIRLFRHQIFCQSRSHSNYKVHHSQPRQTERQIEGQQHVISNTTGVFVSGYSDHMGIIKSNNNRTALSNFPNPRCKDSFRGVITFRPWRSFHGFCLQIVNHNQRR